MLGRPSVLIVDDDANARTALADLLRENGYDVIVADDGEEGLKRVREGKPDVILMDVRLPGMDGYEVCRRIRQKGGATPKVVLYTAYVDAVDAARAREVEADDLLGKTSDFSSLCEIVKNLCQEGT